jgi:hypothetical protein
VLKFLTYLSTIAVCSMSINAANASPLTFAGYKGTYTIDENAGTYKGCIASGGCIKLGPESRVAPNSWSNNGYTYTWNIYRIAMGLHGQWIEVYYQGKPVFVDGRDTNNQKFLPRKNLPIENQIYKFKGSKGIYTFDFIKGIYSACTNQNGCISLGSNHRCGTFSWSNNGYTYSINQHGSINIYHQGKMIFTDLFDWDMINNHQFSQPGNF